MEVFDTSILCYRKAIVFEVLLPKWRKSTVVIAALVSLRCPGRGFLGHVLPNIYIIYTPRT